MQEQDEEFVPEEESEEGPQALKRLREKLKKAVEEKQEYLEGWQRSRADFVNYKKEEERERASSETRAKVGMVEKLLPLLDSMEMAFKQAQSKELNLLHKQLLDALRGVGAEPFGLPGERFDPHKHEALREVPAPSSKEDGTIESVHRSGYSIGEKVVRPAQVSVYSHNQ
jgi:molecular chaperone GrpE